MANKIKNKIFSATLFGVLLLPMISCNEYLDVDKYFDDTLTLDSAFTKRVYAEGFLSNIYEVLYNEVCDITTGSDGNGRDDGGVWVGTGGYSAWASDELLRVDDATNVRKYQNGEYSKDDPLREDKWKRVYEPVRKTSTFLNYIDLCKEMTASERADLKGQAHFVRGLAYWVLLRQYGPLPLIPEEGFDLGSSYREMSGQRNTFQECVDYIEKEFIRAAQLLPTSARAVNNVGRPTKGAALAARARLLLYAASPLFNGNTDMFQLVNYDGVQLIPQEYNDTLWAKAAAAALDVIDIAADAKYNLLTVLKDSTTVEPPYHEEYSNKDFPNGWANIDPFESYRSVFNGSITGSRNPEIIFTRPNDKQGGLDNFVQLSMPKSLDGQNAVAVTLKQVEAYYMNDGRTIQQCASTPDASGFKYPDEVTQSDFTTNGTTYPFLIRSGICLQYANREPRFYASIAYPGCTWECLSAKDVADKNVQVFYYRGLDNGKLYNNETSFPVTGIGLKKYVHPDDAVSEGGSIVTKFEPGIRYADVLLWYAEAINELTPGKTYPVTNFVGDEIQIKRDVNEIRRGMKPIRMRAGLPDFADATYSDQAAFRIVLKKERQIEFFAENKRYYDLRRWKDAAVEENMPIRGYNMDVTESQTQRANYYKSVVVSTYPKIFISPAMYLFPIPQYELTRNRYLTQNPGW